MWIGRGTGATAVAAAVLVCLVASHSPARAAADVVRDDAHLFAPQTLSELQAKNSELRSAGGKQVAVVTTASTNGTPVNQAAVREAQALALNGAIIYIAKDDHQLSIAYGARTKSAFPPAVQETIKSDLRAAFRQGRYDAGILAAVGAIAGRIETAESSSSGAAAAGASRAVDRANSAQADRTTGGANMSWIWWVVALGVVFLLLRSFARRSALANAGAPGMQPPGIQPPGSRPGGYPPGAYPQASGGMGGFIPGLLGGAAGAFLGNELANRGRDSSGIDPAAAAVEHPAADFSGGDQGGGFSDAGGSGDFGGGGDSGGGDFGGGGDGGGGW